MEIPKYVDRMLEKRAKAASEFNSLDIAIAKWLDKNGIAVSPDDIGTGACSICEPYGSINSIRDCIKAHTK